MVTRKSQETLWRHTYQKNSFTAEDTSMHELLSTGPPKWPFFCFRSERIVMIECK